MMKKTQNQKIKGYLSKSGILAFCVLFSILGMADNTSVFIDDEVQGISTEQVDHSNHSTFQLFTHGKSGQLYIDGHWKNEKQIVDWFNQKQFLTGKTNLNIYGCNFAKGEKGKQAVSHLDRALGISVAASDDITGIDGDWDLEVGTSVSAIQIPTYQSNLQYCPDVKYDIYVYYRADANFTDNAVHRVISGAPSFDVSVDQTSHSSATYTTTDNHNQTINWTPIATSVEFNTSGQMQVRLVEDLSSTASGTWIQADAILFVDQYGKEYVIDNPSATVTGSWLNHGNETNAYNKNERYIATGTAGNNFVTWTFNESATSQPDADGDGVPNVCDLDNDNDGIANVNECDSNSVTNGSFTGSLTGWTNTGNWFNRGGFDAYVNTNSGGTYDLSQTITVSSSSAMLHYDLVGYDAFPRDAFIEIYVNGVLVDNQSTEDIVTNAVSGKYHRQIPLNVASGDTAAILFRAIVSSGSGGADDIGMDNVFVGACDDDGDNIPNYLDTDSDGDGCTDAVEAGHIDLNQDGEVDGIGTDTDGKVTGATTAYTGNTAAVRDAFINSACCDVSKSGRLDSDGDGIANFCDLDNDNDGITNVNECDSNSVTNGDFNGAAGLTGWTKTGNWINRSNMDAFVNNNAADTSDLSQTITVATSSAMLYYDLVGNDGFVRGAFIEIYVNSVLVDRQSADNIVANAVSGSYHRQIPLNVASGATATILFRAIVIDGVGNADDVGMDNVFVGACDDNGNDIPNYLEIDSDGDGCTDAVEAGHIDLNQDGIVDGIGTDADGRITGATTAYTGNTAAVTDNTINSACCDVSKSGRSDIDSDGVADLCDLDNDNDGITNVNECDSNSVTNGDFNGATGLTGWIKTGNWINRSNMDAFVNNNAADTSDLSQTITVATSSAMLHYDLVGNDGFVRGAFIEIYVNSVLVDRQSADNIVANTVNGSYHRQIPLNVASGATATILFRAIVIDGTGNADDVGMDNVFVGACDNNGNNIPNYLDTDSDGDGCPDAIEGGSLISFFNLDNNGQITGNVSTDGVPTAVASTGQSIGSSQDASISFCGLSQDCGTDSMTDNNTESWTSAWVDIDNDGYEDLFVADRSTDEPNKVYINNGDGTFTQDLTTGLSDLDEITSSGIWADYDNDGDQDVLILNTTGTQSRLYANTNGTFTEQLNTGLSSEPQYFHSGAWLDIENDGDLDLIIANYFETKFHHVYINNADGTFTQNFENEIAKTSGRATTISLVDFNNDGLVDVFIPNANYKANDLFKNLGNNQFEKITTGPLVTDVYNSVAATWGDYNSDGYLDVYVANSSKQPNQLYKNNGDETFTKVLSTVLDDFSADNHSASWIDIDADMDLDLLVSDDQGVNRLYLNEGSDVFTENSDMTLLTANTVNTMGTATADYDKNGTLDAFLSTHDGSDFLHCTGDATKSFISIKLEGTVSNKDGLGSTVMIKSNGTWQTSQLLPIDGIGSQNSMRLYFGLDTATSIDSILISWPLGTRQVITGQAINQFITVTEPLENNLILKTFNDANNNCTYDAGEELIGGIRMQITETATSYTTDNQGEISTFQNDGVYNIELANNDYWTSNCTNTINLSSDATLFVPLTATSNGYDLNVNLGTSAWRRGFTGQSILSYSNIGTSTAYNVVAKVLYPAEVDFKSADIQPDTIINDTAMWYIDSVASGQSYSVHLNDSVNLTSQIGSTYDFKAWISADGTDLDVTNNSIVVPEEIVGAIDPNDILVWPKGVGADGFISKNQKLTYRIRFQNVGTYAATYVHIHDNLPNNLDVSTLHVESSSHANYQLTVSENGEMYIYYDQINLLDSNANEPESHGYFEFSISPKQDINYGDIITNSAKIAFDYEDPIYTNTVKNRIKIETDKVKFPLEIYPNPSRDKVTIAIDVHSLSLTTIADIDELIILSTSGAEVVRLQNVFSTSCSMNISGLSSGMFFVKVRDTNGNLHYGRLIRE